MTAAASIAALGRSLQGGDQFFGGRNRVINGDFDIWQRAASQTAAGHGSADRFRIRSAASGAFSAAATPLLLDAEF